jgi:NAD(P)-dependent dehydrogenase (short-subunit alcohol dehydrogenase family)
VGPGPTIANIHDGEAGMAKEVAGVPLARGVPAADIAAAVLYLAGARSVTGQTIAVDSGQSIGWLTPDVVA